MGTKLARLLTHYCKRQRIFPKVGNFMGKTFSTGRGVMQGDPASPMILNIVVNVMVRAVLEEVCWL